MEKCASRAGELLWKTARKLRDRVERGGGDISIRSFSPRAEALDAVFAHPDGVMLKDIAIEVGRSAGAASQTIDALVGEGLVERVVSRRDRRALVIFPTEKGREMRAAYLGKLNEAVAGSLETVAPGEREAFETVLEHIAGSLERPTPLSAGGQRGRRSRR